MRQNICLTAEVLDDSFTQTVLNCGDVDCAAWDLFLAVKSQLSEIDKSSQLFHGSLCEKRLILYSTVGSHPWQLRLRIVVLRDIQSGDKQPAP